MLSVTLIAAGLAGYTYINATAYDRPPPLAIWLLISLWIASGAAIGAGIFLPFKWWWLGMIIGALVAFAVLAFFALMGV